MCEGVKEKGKWEKVFLDKKDVTLFDVIVGNPPYNENGTGKGGGVFWKGFVTNALKLLEDNGYLLFIHPPGWRKPSGSHPSAGDIWKDFKQYNLVFVKISDKKITNFPSVDYYVLQKSSIQNNSRVINEFETESSDEQIDLYDLTFIPHLINKRVISILHKLFTKPGEKFNIIYDQSFKPTKADEQALGIPHAYFYDVDRKTYRTAFKEYSKGIPVYINEPKIIMTHTNGKRKAYLYPIYYPTQIGSARNTMYQLILPDDNVDNITKFLNSELIHFILKITQFSESPNHKNEFKILNMISKPNEGEFENENDIYDYFSITQDERDLVMKIISNDKPSRKEGKKEAEAQPVEAQPVETQPVEAQPVEGQVMIKVKKTVKKRMKLTADGGSKASSTKTNTLKRNYKYKHLHKKSINKK